MYLKAALFVVIGCVSVALVIATNPTARICILLALAIWSFCRAYYFAFYVIERYVDPSFKFSGLFSAFKYLATRRRRPVGAV